MSKRMIRHCVALVLALTPYPVVAQLVATELARLDLDAADVTVRPLVSSTLLSGARLALFDEGFWRVQLFDHQLTALERVGSKGEGPGELSPFVGFGNLRVGHVGDSLWTYDDGLRRFTLFTPSLRLARTISLPQPDGRSAARYTALALVADGGVLVAASDPADPRRFALRVLREDGAVLRELQPFRPDSSVVMRTEGSGYVFVPFRTNFKRAIAPSGNRIAHVSFTPDSRGAGTLSVRHESVTGQPVSARDYPVTSAIVTRAMVDSAVGAAPPGRGTAAPERATQSIVRQHVRSVADPFNAGVLGDDGGLWLRRASVTAPSGPIPWAWISPDGTWRGELALNRRETVLAALGDLLWVLDVPVDGSAILRVLRVRSR
jgi:hypothetical protein